MIAWTEVFTINRLMGTTDHGRAKRGYLRRPCSESHCRVLSARRPLREPKENNWNGWPMCRQGTQISFASYKSPKRTPAASASCWSGLLKSQLSTNIN
jgi:hypothetical protein